MKIIILNIIAICFCGTIHAQTQIDSISIKQVLKLSGKRVTGISNNNTNASKDSLKLITEAAAKQYTDAKVLGATPDSSIYLTHTQGDAAYVRIQTQNPTASLSGGNSYELHSAGTFGGTLNWSAGRQAATQAASATANITSIVAAGTTQSFSNPTAGSSVSGSQSVTVTWNTNAAYYLTVTTADGKTATASTSYNFYPKNYFGYSSNATPTAADVLNCNGGSNFLSGAKAYTPTVTLPNNANYYYVYYAYPTNMGALTSIKDGAGNQVISAFTQTTVSITNASGYTQNYYVYTSNNNYSNTSIYVQYQ
ncbi:MAG: hypothetical protein JSR11_03560 [Bacteroidetes bacterium]|nr:hypothetical protein [Bacteroidota bacterium]